MDFAITLENRLFPVQAFFNAMPARSFLEALKNVAKGIGAGFNDAVCEFPDELDEDEEKFTGVKFYIFNEELIVSNADFVMHLKDVCRLYTQTNPDDSARVKQALDDVISKLDVKQRA
ncbi:hypothetical protein HF313_12785 [Massilia atriviolacea]|uniref:CDI immunity protein domain-containing protein n=1 Tax=Massilia atriviolacea TaxID=2495579 RepID=A0A430HQ32_9BURK|nr:ribonuclease toxin immunity protein CdiI [Massilia atriviolacea]RSZ59622.1 hypothetical protein EJB06_05335 [Massilia atriviolacea]